MSPSPGLMPFVDHLEALRRRLLVATAFLLLAWLGFFLGLDALLPWALQPLGTHAAQLVYLRPAEKFLAYLTISFDLALVVTFPVLLVLLAGFVWPALGRRTRGALVPFLLIDLGLLAAALAFTWSVLIPFAVGFFLDFGSQDQIAPFWSLGEYVNLLSSLLLATAVVFQVPPALLFAFRTGLVEVRTVARYRRHAIVLIMVVAAVITPPDVLSQCLVGVPLVLLFEFTLLAGRVVAPRRPHPGSGETA